MIFVLHRFIHLDNLLDVLPCTYATENLPDAVLCPHMDFSKGVLGDFGDPSRETTPSCFSEI